VEDGVLKISKSGGGCTIQYPSIDGGNLKEREQGFHVLTCWVSSFYSRYQLEKRRDRGCAGKSLYLILHVSVNRAGRRFRRGLPLQQDVQNNVGVEKRSHDDVHRWFSSRYP
jgi:hypothetical protein